MCMKQSRDTVHASFHVGPVRVLRLHQHQYHQTVRMRYRVPQDRHTACPADVQPICETAIVVVPLQEAHRIDSRLCCSISGIGRSAWLPLGFPTSWSSIIWSVTSAPGLVPRIGRKLGVGLKDKTTIMFTAGPVSQSTPTNAANYVSSATVSAKVPCLSGTCDLSYVCSRILECLRGFSARKCVIEKGLWQLAFSISSNRMFMMFM